MLYLLIYTNTEGVEDGGHCRVIQVMNRSLWVFHNILQHCGTNEERTQRKKRGDEKKTKKKKTLEESPLALNVTKCSR